MLGQLDLITGAEVQGSKRSFWAGFSKKLSIKWVPDFIARQGYEEE